VQLTVQAGAIGRPGECLVLDMGEPVRIMDVAKRLIAQAERPVRIEVTGLRPGEKLHEQLLAHDEDDVRPFHPLISHVTVCPMTLPQALKLAASGWLTESTAAAAAAADELDPAPQPVAGD
jgi:FlaA1/EpsC-like NDP-sugar epimerase